MWGEFGDLSVSGLAGFISGFLVCIPVGPINVAIINEGARRGFLWSVMLGFGAMVMDTIYCGIAFAGFSSLFSGSGVRAIMELLSFILMFYLGLRYLFATDIPEHTATVDAVEHKFHPHTAFWTGFVRVLGNPAILLFWFTLSATFLAHNWITDEITSKVTCGAGSLVGGMTWFFLLSWVVAKGRHKLSKRNLLMMSQVSGLSLIIAAFFIAARLARLIGENEGVLNFGN
jgi:threonine/homoserine/homoserine lactone efflux protein